MKETDVGDKEVKDEDIRIIVSNNMNPSVEHLVAELIDYEQQIEFYKVAAERKGDSEKLKIIELCTRKMAEVKQAIQPDRWYRRKRIFIAWELLHRIGEELVPFMDKDTLMAEMDKIVMHIKVSSLPDTVKNDLLLRLDRERTALGQPNPDIPRAAAALKTAMNIYNDFTDDRFWDIWAKKLNAFVYAVMLAIFGVVLVHRACRPEGWHGAEFEGLSIATIILLGGMGGLVSGIITGEREYLPKGHFWISTLYYALVRPLMGAVAAVVMFWLLQNHLFINIVTEPAGIVQKADLAAASMGPEVQRQLLSVASSPKPPVSEPVKKDGTGAPQSNEFSSLITLKAAKGKEGYMYAFLLFLAGFSGDKLLKSIADRANARLIAQAEKTREVK